MPSTWQEVGGASFPGACTCQSRDAWRRGNSVTRGSKFSEDPQKQGVISSPGESEVSNLGLHEFRAVLVDKDVPGCKVPVHTAPGSHMIVT